MSQPHVPRTAKQYILRWMIEEIREKISAGQFEFSKHAVDQSILRHVTLQEIREAIADGEIIEDYPDDKYGPSCLDIGLHSDGKSFAHPVQLPIASFGEDHYAL